MKRMVSKTHREILSQFCESQVGLHYGIMRGRQFVTIFSLMGYDSKIIVNRQSGNGGRDLEFMDGLVDDDDCKYY